MTANTQYALSVQQKGRFFCLHWKYSYLLNTQNHTAPHPTVADACFGKDAVFIHHAEKYGGRMCITNCNGQAYSGGSH